MIAGQIASMAPDYVAAKVSAARCFIILDRVPEIDSYSENGQRLVRSIFLFQLITKLINTLNSWFSKALNQKYFSPFLKFQ